jgi:hypothetical protein
MGSNVRERGFPGNNVLRRGRSCAYPCILKGVADRPRNYLTLRLPYKGVIDRWQVGQTAWIISWQSSS